MSSRLVPIFDSLADYVIDLFVNEYSSFRSPAVLGIIRRSQRDVTAVAAGGESSGRSGMLSHGIRHARSGSSDHAGDAQYKDPSADDGSASAFELQYQLCDLLKNCCHHLEAVSKWSRIYVNRLMETFPQVFLDKQAITVLLEMLQLVWQSCKAELDDQVEPVYWFTSKKLNISLQLPDSIKYRKMLYKDLTSAAQHWLEKAAMAAPMEIESLLQTYLVSHVDESLSFEPHVGHSLALDVGRKIRYSNDLSGRREQSLLADNSSPFVYKLGERCYIRGYHPCAGDIAVLKQQLASVYKVVKERPGQYHVGDSDRTRIALLLSRTADIIISQRKPDIELVRLVVWVPLALSHEPIMRSAIHQWTHIVVERPSTELLVMVELTIAWSWMIQKRLGIFSKKYQHRNPFDAKVIFAPTDKSAKSRAHSEIAQMLAPQVLLIQFLAHRFDATRHQLHHRDIVKPMITVLQHTFMHMDDLSTNAMTRSARFQLVNLGFKLLRIGFNNPVVENNFREGVYKLAFKWFEGPPLWSFSGNMSSVASEVRVLTQTRQALKNDELLFKSDTRSLRGWGSSGWGRGRTEQQQQQQQGRGGSGDGGDPRGANHSSLDKARNTRNFGAQHGRSKDHTLCNKTLLLTLIDSEIRRLSAWINPTKQLLPYFASIATVTEGREPTLSENEWTSLVEDAWAVSPKLALYLPKRFGNLAITRRLRQFVHQYPGELVNEPDALKYLLDNELPTTLFPTLNVGAAASMVGTASSANTPPLAFRENKFLLYWAPISPVTATTYFALPNLNNPFLQQYAMRALASFPVDVTFFYIPQLVQALRHDSLGYISKAILEAASISQHFAHQIIWNMKANMYKDESAKEPDGLKPTLDRMIDCIVGQLSGEDQEFYNREFSFFNEVTGISGKLKPYVKKSKQEKKQKIDEEMRKIKVQKDVYLPSNPEATVVDIDYTSGRPLQSHAKAPFMATFYIRRSVDQNDQVQELMPSGTPSGGSSPPSVSHGSAVFSEGYGEAATTEERDTGNLDSDPPIPDLAMRTATVNGYTS
ncbi:phosphatidylinositol-4- kinase, partial [Spiromyces aspiralis]